MQKQITKSHLSIRSAAIAYLLIVFTSSLLLFDSVHAASCGGTQTTIISCNTTGAGGIWSLLLIAINILTVGIGIVAVGGIIYGAILWTTAGDNAGQITKSKQTILNVIIGLVAYALLYPFLQFIIPGGVFNSYTIPNAPEKNTANTTKPGNNGNGSPSSSTSKACYLVPVKSGKKIEGRMYHKLGGQTYAFENSPQGIRYAAKNGYDSIDLDIQVTKDGVPVATHWGKPMKNEGFYDPQGKLSTNISVKDMTFAQISRLRHKDGKSQIYSLDHMISVASANKINLSLEIKSPVLIRSHLYGIAASLNEANVKAYIKGNVQFFAGMDSTLAAARRVGFWTRGTEGTQGWNSPTPTGCKKVSQTSQPESSHPIIITGISRKAATL